MREFAARRAVNGRYSLRAFAATLDADHATVSQIIRGKRNVPVEQIGLWAARLKISDEEAAVYSAVSRIVDEQARATQETLRHWAAEMLALLGEPIHRQILMLSRRSDFRPDSRWIAMETDVSADAVNIALSRLIGLGLFEMGANGRWVEKTGLADITARSFREYVARRIPSPLAKRGSLHGKPSDAISDRIESA